MTTYRIIFRKRATREYTEAIEWYEKRSEKAALTLVKEINLKPDVLEEDLTRFRFIYKYFGEVLINRYPFYLVYFIDEKLKRVIITSVFHVKRNPAGKF